MPTTSPTNNIRKVTAGQTASEIAQSLGQTPEQFLKNNPTWAAKGDYGDYKGLTGKIGIGKTYNIGNTPSSNPIISNQSNIIQSTASDRSKLNATSNAITDTVNGTNTQVTDAQGNVINQNQTTPQPITQPTTQGNIKDAMGNAYQSSMPENMSYQLPQLEDGKKWVFDSMGKAFEMDAKGNITSNVLADQQYNINLQERKDKETFDTNLETLKNNISTSHKNLIDSIKKKAEEQRVAMKDLNSRYLGSKQTAGFRTGGTEYTPEIAMGILKNEEEEGIKRIKEIDDDMNLAIAQAESAKNDKDLALAQKAFDKYTELRKAKETAITNQYKTYLENQKYIESKVKALETEKRAQTDQAIQELNTAAPQLVKDYASAANKDLFIKSLEKSTGLSKEIILGAITKATPKPTTSTTKKTTTTKPFFSPTASDKSIVATFASQNPEIDRKKLETDSEYFYWVLSNAKASVKKNTSGNKS